MPILLLFNKPYGVLSRFTDPDGRSHLGAYISIPDVYPAGRLDRDSEGLLLLTDDGRLQQRIANPRHRLVKTYWAQIEGVPDDSAIEQLRRGVPLRDGMTAPARVRRLPDPGIGPREPPIRFRRQIPTSWIEVGLTEGRNRQVRRMTAAVGFPTLRLMRVSVGPWHINGLPPGQWREADPKIW
ncbi:MAG: pseudouridine synthase [Acidiferrobacteraceae bacterium]